MKRGDLRRSPAREKAPVAIVDDGNGLLALLDESAPANRILHLTAF